MMAAGLKAAWFLAAVMLVTTLGAKADADRWVLLDSVPVNAASGTQVLTMPDGTLRTLAIRLSAKDGPLSLSRIVVTYGNGQIHFENRSEHDAIHLAAGEHTQPIDKRDESRIVDTVALSFEPGQSFLGGTTIEVWGLSAPNTQANLPSKRPPGPGERGKESKNRRFVEVPVFFGTTRQQDADRIKNDRKLATFSGEQGAGLTLGRAIVTVPIERDPGTIPRPDTHLLILHFEFRKEDPNRDFTIAAVDVMPKGAFVDEMRKQVALSTRYRGQAFVFVHGYNVGFDDAVFRTAQIAQDIVFDGPAVLFSWPSRGAMWDYRYDIDTAKASRDALRQLLEVIARDTGVTAVNLVAHSMGNDPVIEVLREQADIISRQGKTEDFKLNEIVLAAPDISRNVFEQFAALFVRLAKGGVTLYASKNDLALAMSKRVAGGLVRAGDVPKQGIVIVPGVESIDISDASTGFFSTNHSAFADRAHLITDMQLLFERSSDKHPPDIRFPVYLPKGSQQKKWWLYR
jgi:esterase/lipase superfamily enzyme